ncbi:hypothetical protein F0562_016139 [Nyssa sinensis]|uniref:PHD-type domain-containing protein n=1 Tax=Nyssa sinensis TaxID=561372 RepID=A0A5J4ZJ63_9ASTE|nr:hypothetical protein F0562_016139 [Nyssa sinensis]
MASGKSTISPQFDEFEPDPTLTNDDLKPTTSDQRTFSGWEMASLWIGLVVGVPSYYLAGSLVDLGMAWWQGIAIVVTANIILLVPLVLTGHPGTRYGISFPVLARSSFGIRGAHIPTILRALVGCGWYGIETWIGAQLTTVWKGMEGIRQLEKYSAPILIVLTSCLLIWAYANAGGFGYMLSMSSRLSSSQFWSLFFPSLTANISFWAPLALNIPDFTRYAKSQTDQIVGQAGLPIFMGAFTFVGLAVTSSTGVIFGRVISNPIQLLGEIGGFTTMILAIFGISLAIITTNIAANVVAPANALVNLSPSKFTFRRGALLTALLGIAFQPWRLLQSSESFVYTWLVGYSALLGPIGGIILADYYLIKHTNLSVKDLYSSSPHGAYYYSGGFNLAAMIGFSYRYFAGDSRVLAEGMKRELAFALEVQSPLTSSVGRTRASKDRGSDLNGVSDVRNSKRLKGFAENESESIDRSREKLETNGFIDQSQGKMEDLNGMLIVVDESNEVNDDVPVEAPRRFTRSALKPKVQTVEGLVSVNGVLDAGENEAVLKVEGNETGGVSALWTPTKKLELKMTNKIALTKNPTTVKELFETGMLEGYSVIYNGGNKGSVLRGTIEGIGILCSCTLCKGCRVVTPCKFEIHACKTYRRAAQYICLENGKSLLQVVEACKKSPLDTLEETIQSFIGSLPVRESMICQNCKGPFLATFAAKVGQLCKSCVDSENLQANPTHSTGPKTRSLKSALVPKSSASSSVRIWSQNKSWRMVTKRSLKPALVPKSAHISSPNRSRGKITKKSSKSALISRSSKSASLCSSPQNKSRWKITKKDSRLHKLVFEDGGLPDGTEVAYYSRGQKLLEGYKKGLGIFCHCCQYEVSPSQFEIHAGWASRRKPYGYIYTSNGVSLHELAISLLKGCKYSANDNDDLCIICADGGNLLLCDGCPRAFHRECASLTSIPRGKWYCKYCQNMFQRERFLEHNANAVAAGRVSGVDPRCIRIVKIPREAEVIACVLCRGYDFSKSGFGPRTVILCDQCEKEYHVGCLKKHKMADLKELPKGKWFCCMDCRRIYSALQNLVIRGEEKLPDSLLDVIKKKHEDKGLDTITDLDVRWRLLSSKIASPETRLLLSKAVAVFHDCFDPIVDLATGRDFIPSMVFGRNIRGQDFGGMYCAVLTVNSSVVSAGILRVFGSEVAELPLVATSNDYQGKGYFQVLFSCIEKLLAFLNVKGFVLPAADEAESIWTDKFDFVKISPEQLSNYRRTCWQILTFEGTSMLQKMVPPHRIINQDVAVLDVSMGSS